MAYADGFWMISLRGAVGAIERTDAPFTSWWRESTLALPVYVFAVLAAMTLALNRFGPTVRSPRTVVATGVLISAGGTAVGIAELVASSVYDFHLQVDHLRQMESIHGICTGSCLDQAQQATIDALVHALLFVSALLVASNLLLVCWVILARGGRLSVAGTAQWPDTAIVPQRRTTGSRAEDLRVLLIAAFLCVAHIHIAVMPGQLIGWPAAAAFFLFLAAADIAIAALLLARSRRSAALAAVVLSAGPLLLWLYSRTAGLPFGPTAGQPIAIGVPDAVACALEFAALLAAIMLLRARGRLEQRRPTSSHARALTLLAMIAVTFIGVAGTAPTWFDQPGSSENPAVVHDHGQ